MRIDLPEHRLDRVLEILCGDVVDRHHDRKRRSVGHGCNVGAYEATVIVGECVEAQHPLIV